MPDVTNIQSGGPRVYYADAGTALPEIDNPTGAIDWTSWTEVPYALESAKIKFVEENEDILPAAMMWRIGDVITQKGVDTITFEWGERDVDALALVQPTATKSTLAAAAEQTGQDILKDGGETGTASYYTLALSLQAPTASDMFYIWHFKKVRFVGDFEIEMGQKMTRIPVTIKLFADPTETAGEQIYSIYEQTADIPES